VSKRKAEELSRPDCPSEPATRRPAPGHLFSDGAVVQGTKDELAAQSSRQLGSTEGGLAYSAVVAGRSDLQQPSGAHKSQAKSSDHTEHTASSAAATRLMSLGVMSRPMCGMPDGTTLSAQVVTNSATPAGKRLNKTSIDVSGITGTCGFCHRYGPRVRVDIQPSLRGRNDACPTSG